MHSISVFIMAFICLIAGAGIGMAMRRILPEHHLSRDSTDVIKLATGLMATLVALVLSLLVSSANTFHGMIENQYNAALANVVQLDQYLQAYGPETRDLRQQLRRGVLRAFRQQWPAEDFGPTDGADGASANPVIELEDGILDLNAATPKQKWFQSQALQRANELVRVRQLLSGSESGRSLPVPIVIALLIVATAILASFSLFVQPNPTVVAALAVAAFAVSGALFLIVELNTPFSGVLQVSSGPAHDMMAVLGR
jgi:hypothetical protein